MGNVLDLAVKKRQLLARRAFEAWARRFPESFDADFCARDLSDETLWALIQPGETAATAVHELIMAIEGLGTASRFPFLESSQKMALTDIALCFVDQMRFEAMRRLGWIEDTPGSKVPLVDLVMAFDQDWSMLRHQTPALSPDHPRYGEYRNTFEGDQSAFVRRLIPELLETFGQKVQNS